MLRVFIADDEENIVSLLMHLVDWEQLDMEIIGTAFDGLTAYQDILALSPDIVITDIRMPHYDGLKIIKKIKEQGLDTQFVVISGYRSFEYAQSAIKNGVVDYLLKPVKGTELRKILSAIKERIYKAKDVIHQEALLHTKINDICSQICDLFVSDIVNGNFSCISNQEVLSRYNLDLTDALYFFFIIKLDARYEPSILNTGSPFILDAIDKFKNDFDTYADTAYFQPSESSVIFFIKFDPERQNKVENILESTFGRLRNSIDGFEGVFFTLGSSSIKSDVAEIVYAYRLADYAIKQRICGNLGRIICESALSFSSSIADDILNPVIIKSFLQCIEANNTTKLQEILLGIFTKAKASNNSDSLLYWNLCNKINNLFWYKLYNNGIINDSSSEKKKEIITTLSDCITIVELKKQLMKSLSDSLSSFYQKYDSTVSVPITTIKNYIKTHYAEKITLDDAAKIVFLNPTYLSKLFKQKMGIGFIEYLNYYRIEQSLPLLREPQYNVQYISEQVGITDYKYFIKLFRKYLGFSPSEYKKKVLSNKR